MKSCKIDFSFFDIEHNRNNTDSVKYDNIPVGTQYRDIIPMWIADMDFKVPPLVEDALVQTSRHGIFGYTDTNSEYDLAVVKWYSQRMNWNILPEWIIKTPGVMFAIADYDIIAFGHCSISGAINISFDNIQCLYQLPPNRKIYIFCQKGALFLESFYNI